MSPIPKVPYCLNVNCLHKLRRNSQTVFVFFPRIVVPSVYRMPFFQWEYLAKIGLRSPVLQQLPICLFIIIILLLVLLLLFIYNYYYYYCCCCCILALVCACTEEKDFDLIKSNYGEWVRFHESSSTIFYFATLLWGLVGQLFWKGCIVQISREYQVSVF